MRAVVFDLGGVVFPSPLDVFRAYERQHGLPHRFLSTVVLADPEHGAWGQLERGELTLAEFAVVFEAECATHGARVDATALMASIGGGFDPRPEMVTAIRAIRARGLRTAALTNNWPAPEPTGDDDDPNPSSQLDGLFDVVVESAVVGLRKPDPRIYRLVCERLGIDPAEAVFLDDLGVNLKAARALGMTTIKVAEPATALADLATVLGFPMTGNPAEPSL